MNDIDLHDLAAAYSLDALDERERVLFERHFSTCDACRSDVAEYRETAAELSSLTSTAGGPDTKAAVMAQIAETRQLSTMPGGVERIADRRRPTRTMTAVLAAAAAVVLFVAGALVVGARSSDDLGDEIAAVLTDRDVQFAQLTSTGEGSVNIAWSGGRVVVLGAGLPAPASGSAYELWAIDESGAHPIRLLDRAEDGELRRVLDIDTGLEPAAWGVTIESVSGSDTPTAPILFAAEV